MILGIIVKKINNYNLIGVNDNDVRGETGKEKEKMSNR